MGAGGGTEMKKNVNKNRYIRTVLIWIIFGLFMFTSLTAVSSGGGDTETLSPIVTDDEKSEDLRTQIQNLESLVDYYKNETQYYTNIYENESVNISNKYLIEINNNIVTINQNITKINQKIEKIEKIILNIEIALFGSLIAVSANILIKKIVKRKE